LCQGSASVYSPLMSEKVKRRLTTILCADAEGYSRLMEADEQATLAGLRRQRAAMAALVGRHDGRIVNTWGDAVIAEFCSVVEAVQCATEIQQELSELDSDRLETERLRFRIGINLGDVIVDGDDIYGDGVNVAARLQEKAEPGGVLISGQVYEQVRNKLPISFELVGDQQVKNIETPILSYRVTYRPDGPASAGPLPRTRLSQATASAAPTRHQSRRFPRSIAALLVMAAFFILVNAFDGFESIWFHWPVLVIATIVALWAVLRKGTSDRPS
jgi:adenylate cyclase